MDGLSETVRRLVTLAATYRLGIIYEAKQVVDAYVTAFDGYQARKAAVDALREELRSPLHRARNRGGLFEQVELHLQRWHRRMARQFHWVRHGNPGAAWTVEMQFGPCRRGFPGRHPALAFGHMAAATDTS